MTPLAVELGGACVPVGHFQPPLCPSYGLVPMLGYTAYIMWELRDHYPCQQQATYDERPAQRGEDLAIYWYLFWICKDITSLHPPFFLCIFLYPELQRTRIIRVEEIQLFAFLQSPPH